MTDVTSWPFASVSALKKSERNEGIKKSLFAHK